MTIPYQVSNPHRVELNKNEIMLSILILIHGQVSGRRELPLQIWERAATGQGRLLWVAKSGLKGVAIKLLSGLAGLYLVLQDE